MQCISKEKTLTFIIMIAYVTTLHNHDLFNNSSALCSDRPCATAGLSGAGCATGRSRQTGQRRVEEFRLELSDIRQHSGQHSGTASSFSPQQLSSLWQLHFLQADWEEAPGCYSNLLCCGISSPLQVSLSDRLSVCPSVSVLTSLTFTESDSFTEQCLCVLYIYIQTNGLTFSWWKQHCHKEGGEFLNIFSKVKW